jgi:glycosyltransferase involved in cell wall biosynthesis
MPALWAGRPDVHLVVAGRGTGELSADDARVDLRGFVPDLDALYAEASCVVVPLTDGGGSPLKFLEALAHGLPVVATPVAAAGLEDLRSGEHFLLAEARGPAMAEAIITALDPVTGRRLGAAGRAAVEERYSVAALADRFAP